MMRTRAMWVCATAALGLLCTIAGAKDIYVRAGAAGDGTKDNPYGHLWKALDEAVRGDVVHVAGGTYEGKNGCGAFTIKVPNLTLAGGYAADFSKRDPFTNHTILQRAKDYKGDWTGLPDAVVAGKLNTDHGGFVLDGFVVDCQTRNAYQADGDINPKKTYNGPCVGASSKDIKIRNCILLNPYGVGIYCAWQGKDNEIVNCFIVNPFYTAISTRAAREGAKLLVKNTTISFVWTQPGKGGGTSLFIGSAGETHAVDNVFMFNQAFAVNNGFGNEDTVLKGNVFFQCQGGYYKYQDADGKNLLVWKADQLADLNDDAESYMLAEAGGNGDADPKCKPDKAYYEKFSNFVASEPGKLNMDLMNQWRQSVGLPLQAEPGSKRKNWGMAYPLASVVPNLVSGVKGKGVQKDGPFASYAAAGPAVKKDYAAVQFDSFQKGAEGVKAFSGKAVSFKAQLGPGGTDWFLKAAPRENYDCYKLEKPGESSGATRNYVFGYFLKGSEAHKAWQRYYARKDRYNKQGGVTISGAAWYIGTETYNYPVGVIVDEVKR